MRGFRALTCLPLAPWAGLPASPLRGRITRPDVRVSLRTSPRPAPRPRASSSCGRTTSSGPATPAAFPHPQLPAARPPVSHHVGGRAEEAVPQSHSGRARAGAPWAAPQTNRRRPPLQPLPVLIRSPRGAARQPGSVTRLPVSDRSSLSDSAPWPPHPCFLFPLRVPVVPATLASSPQFPFLGITALCPRCLGSPTRVPRRSVPTRQLSGSARRVTRRCLAARREIM